MYKIVALLNLCLLFTLPLFAQSKKKSKEIDYYLGRNTTPYFGYSVLLPAASSSLGIFHGPHVKLRYLEYQDPDKDKRPAYAFAYVHLAALRSTKGYVGNLYQTSLGGQFSFENVLQRGYLVPYFGLELGNIWQTDLGYSFLMKPLLGLNWVSQSRWRLSTTCSYPIATLLHHELTGYQFEVNLGIAIW